MQRVSEVIEGAVLSGRWAIRERGFGGCTFYRYINASGDMLCPLAVALAELGLLTKMGRPFGNCAAATQEGADALGLPQNVQLAVIVVADGLYMGDPIQILKDAGY